MVLKPGDVVCLRVPQEVRGVNGRILHPPELRVVVYNAEFDTLSLEPIAFETLKALDFEKYERVCADLRASRDEDDGVMARLPTCRISDPGLDDVEVRRMLGLYKRA